MHHRPSLCFMCPIVSAATSDRRSLAAEQHGDYGAVAQRTPIDFALFTRAVPAANSGASRPLSAEATEQGIPTISEPVLEEKR